MYDRHHFIEEPCAGKLASTVLKTGGVGDDLAEFNRPDAALPANLWIRTQRLQGLMGSEANLYTPARLGCPRWLCGLLPVARQAAHAEQLIFPIGS